MSDLEEVKRLLGEATDHWYAWFMRDESDSNLTQMAGKVHDALSLLEGDMVIMTIDELTELLRLSVELGISEAFESIGLKLEPPAKKSEKEES